MYIENLLNIKTCPQICHLNIKECPDQIQSAKHLVIMYVGNLLNIKSCPQIDHLSIKECPNQTQLAKHVVNICIYSMSVSYYIKCVTTSWTYSRKCSKSQKKSSQVCQLNIKEYP